MKSIFKISSFALLLALSVSCSHHKMCNGGNKGQCDMSKKDCKSEKSCNMKKEEVKEATTEEVKK